MTLFERLRGWLRPTGRDIGDTRYGEALCAAAYDDLLAKGARAWERHEAAIDTRVDMDDTTLDDWEEQGGQPPAGQVPNCS